MSQFFRGTLVGFLIAVALFAGATQAIAGDGFDLSAFWQDDSTLVVEVVTDVPARIVFRVNTRAAAPAAQPAAPAPTGRVACSQVNARWLAENVGGLEGSWSSRPNNVWVYAGQKAPFRHPGLGTVDSWNGNDVSLGPGTAKDTFVADNDAATFKCF